MAYTLLMFLFNVCAPTHFQGPATSIILCHHPRVQEQMSGILQGFLSTVCTLTRLYGDPVVVEAVMQEKESNVEPGTELQELVVNEDFDALVRLLY